MNYESLADGGFQTGTMMGSGGFIVLDEDQCVVRHTLTLARFYRHESCGQCSPCREGTGWMEKILHNIEYGKGKMSDIDLLWDIQSKMEGNTICPLGDAAAWPVAAAIRLKQRVLESPRRRRASRPSAPFARACPPGRRVPLPHARRPLA